MPRPRPGKLIDFGPLLIVLFSKTLFHRRNSPSKRLGFFQQARLLLQLHCESGVNLVKGAELILRIGFLRVWKSHI